MSAQMTISGPRARAIVGLKDGGHVLLRCSNCNKPLCDIFVTQPGKKMPGTNEPFEWRVRARCCYGCKNHEGKPETSYIEKIIGLYHLGGHGIPNPANPDDPDDNIVVTVPVQAIEETDSEGSAVLTFEVMKAKEPG